MTRSVERSTLLSLCALLAAVMALGAGRDLAVAGEQPTEAEIIDALRAKKARALPMAPADEGRSAEQARIIDNAIRKAGRGLGRVERDELMAVAAERAKIDLEVTFNYDSAAVTADGMRTLTALGGALSNPELRGSIFMIAGHTDAKGSTQYNLGLSERRAQAVKQFLIEKFRLPGNSLLAIGYGMEQLKDKDHPLAAENRRVQVVNMAAKPTAGSK
jgi:outer membrane protein OmpA-like peptidoglycan-associated protein